MRLAGLDLNLLVALEVLLTEQSVSAAAARVNLSQSAMSGALARLRHYFQDELLVNVGGRMQPTPMGEALLDPVRDALALIRSTIADRGSFDPAVSDRRFTIVLSDFMAEVLLPDVLAELSRTAPGVSLKIEYPNSDSPLRLERGAIDLLISVESYLSASHPQQLLLEEDFVVIAAADHPSIRGKVTAEAYGQASHILATFGRPSHDQRHLEQAGIGRRAAAVCPNFSLAPLLVAGSDRIATIHRRHALMWARMLPLQVLELPVPVPPLREYVQWHGMRRRDAGLLWLKDLMAACASRAPAVLSGS